MDPFANNPGNLDLIVRTGPVHNPAESGPRILGPSPAPRPVTARLSASVSSSRFRPTTHATRTSPPCWTRSKAHVAPASPGQSDRSQPRAAQSSSNDGFRDEQPLQGTSGPRCRSAQGRGEGAGSVGESGCVLPNSAFRRSFFRPWYSPQSTRTLPVLDEVRLS